MKKTILLCDDDQEIIDLIKLYLCPDDFLILEATNGLEALKILTDKEVDLAIIDIMMPELNGLELIQLINDKVSTPLLILSAKTSLDDRLTAYEIGAQDYMTKPFEPLELVAKIKARLKATEESYEVKAGDLVLDTRAYTISSCKGLYELTKVEFAIMKLFMTSPNRIYTKAQIYKEGWKQDYINDDNSLRVIINRLREKIGSKKIETIRGLGYRLKI